MATVAELRNQVAAFLQERFEPPSWLRGVRFSAFDRRQVDAAATLAAEFGRIAARRGNADGVADVLKAARQEVKRRLPGLVKYALMLFLTHDPIGSLVGTPSLEERHPAAVEGMIDTQAARTAEDPKSLSFFREDIYANDHHAHWHEVYAADPRPQERQGEIFLYMHQQMLARYDTERIAVGRGEVDALPVDTGRIDEGYDPHMAGYAARPDNQPLRNAGDMAFNRDSFLQAIEDGVFEDAYRTNAYAPDYDPRGPQPVLGLLGGVLEAEGDPLPFAGSNMHNSGHVNIAFVGRDPQGAPLLGVMRDPAVAIRDPVFWRWHKVIDNIGTAWQDKQPVRNFRSAADRGPAVRVRDTILTTRGALPFDGFTDTAAGTAWAEQTFGGPLWDDDAVATRAPATNRLDTHMTTRPGRTRDIEYLDMVDEFAYLIRLENTGSAPVETTVRIFIVAERFAEDRRRWIEMDKFLHTAKPGRSVVYRPSALSSVIRKPATRPPGPTSPENGRSPSAYCQCGWPYNLLLPRGNKSGMPFRLLAMLTDTSWDRGHEPSCGSMSFCGVRDSRYPDQRNMGYPFDRRLPGGIVSTLDGLKNAAVGSFTIRRVA